MIFMIVTHVIIHITYYCLTCCNNIHNTHGLNSYINVFLPKYFPYMITPVFQYTYH